VLRRGCAADLDEIVAPRVQKLAGFEPWLMQISGHPDLEDDVLVAQKGPSISLWRLVGEAIDASVRWGLHVGRGASVLRTRFFC
jgi:hypothetical protein